MRTRLSVRLTLTGALLACLTAGVASAATIPVADMRTTFTFSGPVAVPFVTLPAGTYLFRVVDTDHRDVIQVLSGDGKIPYSLFFALRAVRDEPPSEPEVG